MAKVSQMRIELKDGSFYKGLGWQDRNNMVIRWTESNGINVEAEIPLALIEKCINID